MLFSTLATIAPFLAVCEGFPLQQIVEGLVRITDRSRPEPGLLDAVPLPDPQGDRVEALQQIGQTARYAVIDAQLVEHLVSPFILRTRRLSAAGSYW